MNEDEPKPYILRRQCSVVSNFGIERQTSSVSQTSEGNLIPRRISGNLARLSEENVELHDAESDLYQIVEDRLEDEKLLKRSSSRKESLNRRNSHNASVSLSEDNVSSLRDNNSSSVHNPVYRMPTGQELQKLLNTPEPIVPQAPIPEFGTSQERSLQCSWVEHDYFIGFTALVICVNTGMVILEEKNPENKDEWRRIKFVIWNLLDLTVVLCGVVDQWVLPHLVKDWRESPLISTTVRLFRTARLLRVFRLARILVITNFEWAYHPRFETFIAVVIAFNAVVMGFETDLPWDGWYWIEQALLFIFVFELSVRFKRLQSQRFFCGMDSLWNWLDLLIVASGVIDQWMLPIFNQFDMQNMESEESSKGTHISHLMTLLRMLRLMRILRLLRLVKTVRPLYHLAMGVLEAMQSMFWVIILTSMILYAFAILLTRLIGHELLMIFEGPELEAAASHFSTVEQSMFTLFRIMNGDVTDIRPLFSVCPIFRVVFVIFMVTSSWALLSILTAVVSDNMISVTQQQNSEIKEEERQAIVNKLGDQISSLDLDQSGEISQQELETFMQDPRCAEKFKQLRISMLDADDVWRALQRNGACETSEYLEGLSMAVRPISEKSLMRIEGKLKNAESTGCFVDVEAREEIYKMREIIHDQLTLLTRIVSRRKVVTRQIILKETANASTQTDPEDDTE